jgi:hypothetical protein
MPCFSFYLLHLFFYKIREQVNSRWWIADGTLRLDLHDFEKTLQIFMAAKTG